MLEKEHRLTIRDLIYIGTLLLTIGVQWGVQRLSVSTLKEDLKEIKVQTAKLPAYEQAFKTIEVMYRDQSARVKRLEDHHDKLRGELAPFIDVKRLQ